VGLYAKKAPVKKGRAHAGAVSLCNSARADKTGAMIRKIFLIALGLAAGAYGVLGVVAVTQALRDSGAEAGARKFEFAFACVLLLIGALAGVATFLGNKKRGWLIVAPVILGLGLPVAFFASFWIEMEKGEIHRRQFQEEVRSGRHAFGHQPALLAVAQAIVANDQEAIRAAAKAVPDLQAAGRDGATLLCFAVRQTWQHRELVESVKTLLSLGANPNFTNGQRDSYALANAVHGPAAGLRAMLDAGGDPNALSEYGWPIVFMHFKLAYYQDEERERLDLLLDRGADINSTVPARDSENAGYPLLLYTTRQGASVSREYLEALHLLERGADPSRAGTDGMTFAQMLTEQREQFARAGGAPPPREFARLWDWAKTHGLLHQVK
jgi:hypothetical protein